MLIARSWYSPVSGLVLATSATGGVVARVGYLRFGATTSQLAAGYGKKYAAFLTSVSALMVQFYRWSRNVGADHYPSDAEAQSEAYTFCVCQVPVWALYLGIGNPTIPSILSCRITTLRNPPLSDTSPVSPDLRQHHPRSSPARRPIRAPLVVPCAACDPRDERDRFGAQEVHGFFWSVSLQAFSSRRRRCPRFSGGYSSRVEAHRRRIQRCAEG